MLTFDLFVTGHIIHRDSCNRILAIYWTPWESKQKKMMGFSNWPLTTNPSKMNSDRTNLVEYYTAEVMKTMLTTQWIVDIPHAFCNLQGLWIFLEESAVPKSGDTTQPLVNKGFIKPVTKQRHNRLQTISSNTNKLQFASRIDWPTSNKHQPRKL
jgi:hypothetical protein